MGVSAMELHVLVSLARRLWERVREVPATGWCSLWVAVALALVHAASTTAGVCGSACCLGYAPSSSGTCGLCSPGYYCRTTTGQTPCPAGTFNPLPGATNASWCLAYATRCAAGQYVSQAPSATRNASCAPCRAACGAGQYRSGACGGADAYDVVTCIGCRACDPGLYHQTPCDGTPASDPVCVGCTAGGCPVGQYRGPCSQDANGACANCTRCPAGQYNRGCGGDRDGNCTACTACGTGWAAARACSALEDTVCAGGVCNASTTCGALFCSYNVTTIPGCTMEWRDMPGGPTHFLCRTSVTTGVCQECPPGWTASGAYCVECPAGASCDERGRPACAGQCAVDFYPACDPETGRAVCGRCAVNHTAMALSHQVLTRGGVLDAPGLCGAYFQCAVGYYLASVNATAMGCLPCQWPEASQAAWAAVSHGLTFGDAYSCLYAGAASVQAGPHGNELGFYGAVRTSCPYGQTSRPGWAGAVSDCVACPSPPPHGAFATQRYDCAAVCLSGYLQLGEACLNEQGLLLCPEDGYLAYDGGCLPQALPWSRPGWQFAGVAPNVTGLAAAAEPTAAYDSGYRATAAKLFTPAGGDLCGSIEATGGNLGYLQDRALTAVVCKDVDAHAFYLLRHGGAFLYAFLERSIGNNNRYVLWQVEARQGGAYRTGQVWQTWRLPGRVCSAAVSRLDGAEYLYLAFCNASFVAFVRANDLTDGVADADVTQLVRDHTQLTVNRRVGLLIGADGVTGSADGMRDVARFGSELSVANTTDPRRLLVADRHNCRLVEVVIDAPGSFLTRAATIGAHACYSAASQLLFPRLLTSVLGGAAALFVTDEGLMQIDFATRTVQAAVYGGFLPLDPAWVGVEDGGSAVVLANRTHAATLARAQLPCPAHHRSHRGGGCLPCRDGTWASGALCAECTPRSCPAGWRLDPCSGNADSACVACAAPSPAPGYPFRRAPDCAVVPLAPCPAGHYNLTAGGDCALCPSFASGAYANASAAMVCGCFPEAGRMAAGGACVVPSPFAAGVGPLPAPDWARGLNCTFRECERGGCYLASAFPRACAGCPEGTFGANGLWCEACPGFRDPSPARDACLCRPPSDGARALDTCVCPVGHEALGPLGCSPCPPGFYQPDPLPLDDDYASQFAMCAECPPGYGSPAGASDCAPCAAGLYREAGMRECARCVDPLAYALDPADRASCRACRGACAAGEEWKPCPVSAALFACEACAAPLYADRQWVAGADNTGCLWECRRGYFQSGDPADCWPCSDAGGFGCPPGKVLTACSPYADAHCDRGCVNGSMPLANAEWSGVGCEWRCAEGSALYTKAFLGWTEYACVAEAERSSAPWGGWW